MDYPEELILKTRELLAKRVGASIYQSLQGRTEQDWVAGRLAHQLTAFVLTEQVQSLTQQTVVHVPASTWQMWKSRGTTRFHRWLVRRWPVKTTAEVRSVTFTRDATYPLANLSVPELGRVVFMERMERS